MTGWYPQLVGTLAVEGSVATVTGWYHQLVGTLSVEGSVATNQAAVAITTQ